MGRRLSRLVSAQVKGSSLRIMAILRICPRSTVVGKRAKALVMPFEVSNPLRQRHAGVTDLEAVSRTVRPHKSTKSVAALLFTIAFLCVNC